MDVVVFCHNHEEFVEAALRGIFSQKTEALVRIKVLDDASTDATVKVIQETLAASPFEAFLQANQVNQYQNGSSFKYNFALDSSADFIAFLDADDYWTDPLKLERQIQLLNRQPKIALCHTRFFGLDESTGETVAYSPPPMLRKEYISGVSLSQGNFIGTLTVVVRRSQMPAVLPPGFNRLRGVDDFPIWAIITDRAGIGYLDEPTGIYRLHGKNNYARQSELVKRRQILDAMVWIANSVDSSSVEHWLRGIEDFVRSEGSRSLLLSRLSKFIRMVVPRGGIDWMRRHSEKLRRP